MHSGLPSQGEPPSSIAAMLQGFVVVSGVGRAMLALLRLAPATTALGLLASTESPRLTSSVRESGARPDLSPHLQPPLLSMWSVRNATCTWDAYMYVYVHLTRSCVATYMCFAAIHTVYTLRVTKRLLVLKLTGLPSWPCFCLHLHVLTSPTNVHQLRAMMVRKGKGHSITTATFAARSHSPEHPTSLEQQPQAQAPSPQPHATH